MDKPKTTAKDFFLWFGAMVAFYWSITASVMLIFDYINYLLPNALAYYPADPYQSGISAEMASVIVLFPLFLFLMHLIRKDIVVDPSRKEIWVRRWALILTLFVAGIAMAADLITLLTTFLNGEEMTLSFLLKTLVVFGTAAKIFWYFILDLKGYWSEHPSHRRFMVVGTAIFAVVVIVAGFFIVGTPAQARQARFDAQKVSDLQNLQSQVVSYWQAKQKLPAALSDLNNASYYGPLPTDPQTGESYVYQTTGQMSFKICADFNAKSRGNQNREYSMPTIDAAPMGVKVASPDDYWQHSAGNQCFEKVIDPAFYPPTTAKQVY